MFGTVDGQNIQTLQHALYMLNPRTPKSQCFSARVSKSDVRGLIFFVHWG